MGLQKRMSAWVSGHAHLIIAISAALFGFVLFVLSGIGESHKAVFVFLQDIEQRSLDLRFALRGSRRPDPRIAIVAIDEKTLQSIGVYPLPRSTYARLVEKLEQDGARVIAFDVTFPLPESSGALNVLNEISKSQPTAKQQELIRDLRRDADVDTQFAGALTNAGNVVLGHVFLDAERAQGTDSKRAAEYFDVIWGKAFPRISPVSPGKEKFDMVEAWAQAGGAVAQGVNANLPIFAQAAASYGFFNIDPDDDGTLRRALFLYYYRYQNDDLFFPSLDLEVLQLYEGIPDAEIQAYISAIGLNSIQFGSHTLRPRQDGKALINYSGPYHTYPHFSMSDVIDGKAPVGTFRDKIVLVGATALGIGDLRNTPFQQQKGGYMGVEVHANIIDNLLHSDQPHRTFLVRGNVEEWVDMAMIVLFGAGLGLWFGHCRPATATLTVVVVLAGFLAFIYLAFAYWGRWFSVVIPTATLLLAYLSATSYRVVFEEGQKRQIRSTFSHFVSPAVISFIMRNPERYLRPGGEMRKLTIMFTDIRNFTTISETMDPDSLVKFLNEYFTAMTDILLANYGTLDKFIGDAVMAFWGSPAPLPKHAYYACLTALTMVERLAALNRDWAGRGFPQIAIGIGVNSGPANVGNIGSEKRLSWTVMGDNVNLASRLESMTKQYHVKILISESTYQRVRNCFLAREIDKIRVKGRTQPVTIYELISSISESASFQPLLSAYTEALECYRAQHWQEAAEKLRAILLDHPDDGPSHVLLDRCLEFLVESPSENWDGVYEMKSK
jgi:adenylate cyclase